MRSISRRRRSATCYERAACPRLSTSKATKRRSTRNGKGSCASAPSDCPAKLAFYPCTYDPTDIPFQYSPAFRDNPRVMRDFSKLETDVASGSLPSVSFVKAIGYKTEHPGAGTTITQGAAFTAAVVDRILGSSYANSTLVLVVYDESGGYFDHVAPPAPSPIDGKPYGARVPLLALGPFARVGGISHVAMEHSSIVRFIEWNWLDGKAGQLAARDTIVSNLGSMLEPSKTGSVVPE